VPCGAGEAPLEGVGASRLREAGPELPAAGAALGDDGDSPCTAGACMLAARARMPSASLLASSFFTPPCRSLSCLQSRFRSAAVYFSAKRSTMGPTSWLALTCLMMRPIGLSGAVATSSSDKAWIVRSMSSSLEPLSFRLRAKQTLRRL